MRVLLRITVVSSTMADGEDVSVPKSETARTPKIASIKDLRGVVRVDG